MSSKGADEDLAEKGSIKFAQECRQGMDSRECVSNPDPNHHVVRKPPTYRLSMKAGYS